MKLSTKLILSFSIVIVLVGGIGIASSYINESVKDQVTSESKQAIEEIELAGEMGLQLYRSLTRAQYLLEGQYRRNLSANFSEVEVSNEVVNKNIDSSLQNFRQSIQDTRELVKKEHPMLFGEPTDTTNVLSLLDRLDKNSSIYTSLIDQLQRLSSKSYTDGKEFFTVTIEPYFRTNLLPLIEQVRNEIQNSHEQKIAGLNSQLDRVGYILGIATIFALMIAISLTFFLYRSIANPIEKLVDAAQNIAQGNLDDRIDCESNDELGQLSQTFNNMAESLSRTTVSRDYVDSIIESMADLLIVTDENYNISRINSAGLTMLDSQKEELLGKPVASIFKQGNKSDLFADKESANTTMKGAELLVDNQEGLPVNVSKGVLQDRQGIIEGYVIVASDISSEKEAQQKIQKSLKEKEVLLAEVHHRVKNNLAVISGLLQMQIWEAENELAASALRQSQLRVQSIALVHEKLYQTESLSYIEFDKYVRDLLQTISSTYLNKESAINIDTDLESIVLNINQAIPCSLLLNEIVVNVFYPDHSQQEKTIKVIMSKDENTITMCVKGEKGFNVSKGDTEDETLRKSLIETLSQQLSGDLQFRDAGGTEVIVTFDVDEAGGKSF